MPERIKRSRLIAPERVMAVEAGACPHTAIREDPPSTSRPPISSTTAFKPLDLILIEAAADNLASTFSLDLVDYWLFVIDVAGGDDIPRKRGPGVLLCRPALIINKTDLAPYVRVDLDRMLTEAKQARGGKPILLTNCATGEASTRSSTGSSRDVLFDRSAMLDGATKVAVDRRRGSARAA